MSLIERTASMAEDIKPKTSVKGALLNGKQKQTVAMEVDRVLSPINSDDRELHAESFGKDQYVDVIGFERGVSTAIVKSEHIDTDVEATEQSSSFGDTFSGPNETLKISSSDVEVESPLCIESGHSPVFHESSRLFKKKKVTAHWRKFISPLMWRCQWLELRMNELQSQVLKYDKELAAYMHEKQLQLKMIDLNDSVSRSVPLTCKNHRKKAMKRRKRRRNEDSINILSYMSNHNIFSYYENKRCETDGHSVDDDFSDQANDITRGSNDHLWALDFRDGDHSLEQVLLCVESLQSRIVRIKASLRQRKSVSVRDAAPGCSLTGDHPVSAPQSPSYSLGNIGHQILTGAPNSPPHNTSDYEMEDMVLPGSAVSSYGDAPDLDIIESTMGLLSGADGSLNSNQLEEFCKDNADDVLINNQVADEELQNFEFNHLREKEPHRDIATAREPNSGDESTAPAPAPAPASVVLGSAVQSPGGEKGANATQNISHTGKRRGRKPKRRRRGGSFAAGWKSEWPPKRRKSSG